MKSMLLLTIALSICSCAGAPRLKIDLCGLNFASNKPAHLHCFDTDKDYTDDGVLKPGAKAHDKLIGPVQSLNAGKYISKEDWKTFEAWFIEMRSYGRDHCK